MSHFLVLNSIIIIINIVIAVGSKLAKWMKGNGETKYCRYQLEQAEYEQDPRRIEVYDIGKFLRIIEEMAREWKIGKSVKQDEVSPSAFI